MTVAKQGAKTVVPRLRFPEFRDAQAWDQLSLEELEKRDWVELGRGNVISASDMKDVPGEYPVYSSSIKNDGYMGSYGQFMFDEELISWSVDGGGNFFHRPRHKFSVTNVSGYMRLKTDRLLYRFVASQLQLLHAAQKFDYQLKAHPSVIRKLYRLGLPSPAEQQKIADCLTSLDEVIAAQGRKVEALKAHKRGLMQQLFPREGETRPRLRFPEFRNAPEWEEKKLSALVSLISGLHLSPDQYSSSGNVPYFTGPSDFTNDIKSVSKWTTVSSSVAAKHDTLITVKGSGVGECWHLEVPRVAMGRQLMAVRSKAASSQFIHQFLLTRRVRFEDLASGNLIPGLSRGDILDMVAPFPKENEQQRIADCLSSLDTRITAESNQLAALKTHKQGLMQQLFPAPESV